MSWQYLWQKARRGYWRVNAFLEAFYRLGPAAHGIQGILREFLDGPPDGIQVTWMDDPLHPVCRAWDHRGSYRIEVVREDGRWLARSCSCLAYQEFRKDCRHLRAARQALASGDVGKRYPVP